MSDIFTWFHNPDPSDEHIFWLTGTGGTGKSATARTIADAAQEQGRLAATFFFSSSSVAIRTPSAIIPTIVYQLALCLPSIRPLICAALTSDPHLRDRDVAVQAKALLENMPWPAISNGPFLVVLDALDECHVEDGREGGKAVPKLLETFRSLGCIKFLIASRPESSIKSMFYETRGQMLHQDIHRDIENSVVQSDIRHYLQHSFAEVALDRKIVLPFPSAQDLDELVRRAGSLFVYAATVAKWISDPAGQPLLRLQQVLENVEDEWIYSYTFLDDIYSKILSQAAKTSGNPRKHASALKNVLSTVILLQEPVPASALAILAGEQTRTASLLPLLSAVLLVGEPPAPVRLFHPSFPRFITEEYRCRDERFWVRHSEGHLHLAFQCLEVMNMHLQQNIYNIKDPSLLNTKRPHLQQAKHQVTLAGLSYACKHWHAHLRLANDVSSGLVQSLETFCTAHLLHWLELLSLLNELPTAETGIPMLLAYLRVCV
jgi:hypothetical protein